MNVKCKNYLLTCATITALLIDHGMVAQGVSVKNLHVGAGGELYSAFPTALIGDNVSTNRSATPGVMSFNSLPLQASVSGYVDGYVRIYNGTGVAYIPVGQGAKSSAVSLSGILKVAQPVTALYSNVGAGNPTLHNNALFMVLNNEQWSIKGDNIANVKLEWTEASNISIPALNYSLNLNDVTIAAWNGSEWISIPSTINSGSSFKTGSLTSVIPVNFNEYSLFTLALKRECAAIVALSNVSTSWNGSVWSNGLPTEDKVAIINAPLTVRPNSSFTANGLQINAEVTIQNGAYLDIIHDAIGNEAIKIASEGSFIQRSSAAQAPAIVLSKTTRPLRKWDAAYWGTPVAGDIKSQIGNATAVGYQTPALDNALKYVSQAGEGGSWKPLDATVPGQGFITHIKEQAPFINDEITAQVSFPIAGIANNGNITAHLGSATTGARSYNLLSNPYPSAIDGRELLRSNPNLGGAIYLWTSKGFNSSGATADYAIWTIAGSVATSPIEQLPTGYIASGQGFMVKGLTANGTVDFNNCMRVEGNNNNYYRSSEIADRFWLNLTNKAGVFSQILINYMDDATYGVDRLYDANRNSVSSSQLYSYIENNKYAINSRPPFDAKDIVPLGVSRTESDDNLFTIDLHKPEGIFEDKKDEAVIIYLHDKLLNTYHNLKLGSYTFNATELQNNDRFEIVYEARPTMGIDDSVTIKGTTMTISAETFKLTTKLPVSQIEIYDITGRLVQQYKNVNGTTFSAPFNHAVGIYIAKAKLENGAIATQKLINGR